MLMRTIRRIPLEEGPGRMINTRIQTTTANKIKTVTRNLVNDGLFIQNYFSIWVTFMQEFKLTEFISAALRYKADQPYNCLSGSEFPLSIAFVAEALLILKPFRQ